MLVLVLQCSLSVLSSSNLKSDCCNEEERFYSQSKIISTIDKCRSKIARNSVFDCHLSPVGRQMAIEILCY